MSGHVGRTEICSTCNNPVHVELCPGQLPALVSCGDTYGANLQQQSFNPLGGAGFTWVVEKSGVATTILYTLPSNASADQVEQLVNRAKAGNGSDFVGTLRWSLGGALTPFPNTEWPSHGISYERASATTVRITWTPTNFAEDWSNTLVSLSSQQAWLTNTTSFTEEGLVNAWPLANLVASVWQKSLTSSVQTLPVSVPCGVEISNADELALAIGAQLGGGGSSAATSDTEVVERFVCASGVTLVQRTIWTNGVAAVPTYFGVNGAAVAAPATYTQGACATVVADNEFIPLCDVGTNPPTPYIRRAIVDPTTGVVTFTNINVTTGAVYAPVTPGTCDGYSLVSDDACLVTNATGAITSVRVTQLYRYGQIVGAPVIVNLQTNAVVTVAAGQTLANCDSLDLATDVFCRIDTGATLLRKVLSIGSLELFSEWIDAVTLATVAAPPAAQLTQDCDIATDFEVVCASIGGVQVSVEVRRTFRDGVLLSTVYTRLDTNAVIAAPTIVPCAPETGARTVLRCGATSNATTTANVQATRVALENDVILVRACPTTAALTNNTFTFGVNAAVAVGATAVPANARSVTVYNVTRARITFSISSHGTVQIPPNGTYTFNLPDNVPPFSGTFTIANAAGNAGPNVFGIAPACIVDWGTRV